MEDWKEIFSLVMIYIIIACILATAIYLVASLCYNILCRQWKSEFNRILESKLNSGDVKDKSDVEQLFRAFIKELFTIFKVDLALENMLENFILHTNNLGEERKNLINSIINKVPFEGVNYGGRVLLATIFNDLNNNAKNNYSAIENLKLLGDELVKRKASYKKLKRYSKWSFAIALIGTAGTIIGIYLQLFDISIF